MGCIFDFIFEVFFEFIFDIIFEGTVKAASSKRVPMLIRVLCAIIVILVNLVIIAVMLFFAIAFESIIAKVICFALALVIIVGEAYPIIKKIKSHKQKKESFQEKTDND